MNAPPTFFRREAVEAYLRGRTGQGLLRADPGWAWALTLTAAALVAAAAGFALFGRVEVTGKGPGILRPRSGVRRVTAAAPGRVVEILARTGDRVRAGDPLLRLEAPRLSGEVLEAERALAAQGRDFARVEAGRAALFDQRLRTLRDRIRHLGEEVGSLGRARDRAARSLAAHRELWRQGILSPLAFQEQEDRCEAAQRTLAARIQDLAAARQDLAALDAQRRQEQWRHATDLALAQARRQALDLHLRATTLAAPADGVVDGVVLRAGDEVAAGTLVAKVVPVDVPLVAIAFLPEKDRAFVREGDPAQLELSQYPYAEFGTLRARVARVGADLASPSELREAFGDGGPDAASTFKVDLEPGPTALPLRPGMLLEARFTLRRQSLAALALDPLRRWLR